MAHYHESRTAQWGHWGITFMLPQPDPTKNFGLLHAYIGFPVGNAGPCDGILGSPEREDYRRICRDWTELGVLPANATPAEVQWPWFKAA